ncbi:rhomboid family intramembrane serine protease [Cytophagaceae bacterium ABcell3]|nr:rhomboid family intramembrane serine protease [Cytophagaceae bacterium ABcell3]
MVLSATTFIIIVTVIASLYAWSKPHLYQKWMLNPYQVKNNKQYWRFITSGFIHADYIHLGFNMFSLYFLGRFLEQVFQVFFTEYGSLIYIGLYLAGIIVSDIPTYLKHKENSYYNSLGASGGVSAVLFSYVLFQPTHNLYLFAVIPIPAIIFGLLYLLYSYQMARRGGDFINHDAHFYGAVFGIVATIILIPDSVRIFIEQINNWQLFSQILLW